MRNLIARIFGRLCSLRRDEEGFVVAVTLAIFLFLFVLCASIYAVGETVRTKIKLQNACDAAAYSAAVVQADGLSRMATINRAMSWTYAHMTNMQMDYITYRWLRLTEKRFREDHENAKAYHSYIVANFNLDAGWISAVLMVFDALTSRWAELKCTRHHEEEGIGWWCGSGPKARPGDPPKHTIRFNGHRYNAQTFESLQQTIRSVSPVMDEDGTGGDSGALTAGEISSGEEYDDHDDGTSNPERDAINEEYQKKIDALDKDDSDYEARKAELEDERDRKLEEEEAAEKAAEEQQEEAERANSGDFEDEGSAGADEEAARILQDGRPDASGNVYAGLNKVWGAKLGKAIDADKANIRLMNAMLSVVNINMYESMKNTAHFVLASMLRDSRMESDRALKNYSAYFYIPRGSNPYQMGDNNSEGEQASNFFSPLYNTEPSERLFLQMNSTDHAAEPLYSLFPTSGNPSGSRKGWGIDQWFMRGGVNPASDVMPTTVRTEGSLGIQRCYKDSNINETGAGIQFLRRYVSRGNHIANLFMENMWLTPPMDGESSSSSVPGAGNALRKLLSTILDTFVGGLVDQYADITPSAGNASSDELFAMCPKSSDTVALYSDYDWSSAKWICIQKPKLLSIWADLCMCALLTGKCKAKKGAEIYCDWGTIRHRRKFPKFKWWHTGLGHWHFPKWFCGLKPRYAGDGGFTSAIPSGITSALLIDMIPPIFNESIANDNRHGYMKSTLDVSDFIAPLKPLVSPEHCRVDPSVSAYHPGSGGGGGYFEHCVLDQSREDYESCVCMMDGGPRAWNFFNDCVAGAVNGHARIYGDDREIFDDRYIGEKCEPWVLNEKFFNGLGTVVVGVALKHENPFVQLYNFWGSDEKVVSEKNVLSAFDPPAAFRSNGKAVGSNN